MRKSTKQIRQLGAGARHKETSLQAPRKAGLLRQPSRLKKSKPKFSQAVRQLLVNICELTGIRNDAVAVRIAWQVAQSIHFPVNNGDATLAQAINMLAELAPQNEMEALLAAQMIATHDAALMFMNHATLPDQTFEGRDANVLRASRLMRLHLDQIEAMQKLKGNSGQQKVTVEHVHVHKGGQAIVGAVNAGKGEGGGGQ